MLLESDNFAGRCSFGLTLRFEPFYALQVVTAPDARIHAEWSARARRSLQSAFHDAFARLGRASELWPLLPDALDPAAAPRSYDELRAALESVPDGALQERLLGGVLHEPRSLRALMRAGSSGLFRTLGKASAGKREWLAFAGLYPPRYDAPLFVALRLLLDDAPAFRASVLAVLDAFFRHAFGAAWRAAEPALLRSCAERGRLLQAVTFAELARELLLRVEVHGRELRAVRGGYRVRFDAIRACRFVPSLFNDRRYWHAYETDQGTIVHFPYFEPALAVPEAAAEIAEPEIDPALVFRALGDATRYAMATLIARRPMPASELARALSLSKPTVSHHVGLLRDAGLLCEAPASGSVVLSLRRDVLEQLSAIAVEQLFDTTRRVRPHALPRSRRRT